MKVLPPGNILQNIYLKERVKKNKPATFLEIGSGNGYVSNLLLKMGLKGVGYDLNHSACQNNIELNNKYIKTGNYNVFNADFTSSDEYSKFDLIISSMVIEHLEMNDLSTLVEKCKRILSNSGYITFLVPSSMKYWGIEDEIAGHVKRYEFKDFKDFEKLFDLNIQHLAGLTYPLSNFLFRLSNYLVKKNESSKLKLSQKEKTVYTGNRNVPFKTSFPSFLYLILNEFVMYPFHLLQKLFKNNKGCMVLYCELKLNDEKLRDNK